jgi:hypothetical protein
MLIKEADKIIISLSQPDKMPGYAYGLPAWECKTGAKLVDVLNSVCSGCYALKGNYTRFPAIRESQYKRLKALRHPLWVKAMALKINSKKVKFFRWHDAGDVQDLKHLAKIFEVCRRTPGIKHWMPTREAWTKKYIERAPSNLVIRFSGTMIDQPAVKSWPNTSTVVTDGSRTCNAPDNAGQCGSCRKCWNKEIKNISYGKH